MPSKEQVLAHLPTLETCRGNLEKGLIEAARFIQIKLRISKHYHSAIRQELLAMGVIKEVTATATRS